MSEYKFLYEDVVLGKNVFLLPESRITEDNLLEFIEEVYTSFYNKYGGCLDNMHSGIVAELILPVELFRLIDRAILRQTFVYRPSTGSIPKDYFDIYDLRVINSKRVTAKNPKGLEIILRQPLMQEVTGV